MTQVPRHQSLDITTCAMPMPRNGDIILVLKQNWLSLVLDAEKRNGDSIKDIKSGEMPFLDVR